MIKNIKFNSTKLCFIGFVCLISFYASTSFARTLIFQSGSSSETEEKTTQVVSEPVKVVEPIAQPYKPVQNNTASANSELFFMIEQLQNEVNALRGLLEEQSHELKMLKERGKERYLDLDTRILDITKRVSHSPMSPTPATPNKPVNQKNSITEQKIAVTPVTKETKLETKQREPTIKERQAYDEAYALIKDKKFDESILALFSYTENYPDSPLMPNVYYWLGEVYLATAKLEQAKTSFSLVIKAYNDSPKVSDALYKLALTHDRLGEKDLARDYLKEVQENYPNTTAAKLASGYKLSQ